jgi:hypothetical protein
MWFAGHYTWRGTLTVKQFAGAVIALAVLYGADSLFFHGKYFVAASGIFSDIARQWR